MNASPPIQASQNQLLVQLPTPHAKDAPASTHTQALLDLSPDACIALVEEHGGRPFHGRQLYRALHQRRITDLDQATDLSQKLRAALRAKAQISRPAIDTCLVDSLDGTRKYRFLAAADNASFEAVYIPSVARGRTTNTLCISSQTGCAVGCKFCFTASIKRHRNLSVGEILGQVLQVQDDVAELGDEARVTNIVFMGMGEPLLNFDAVIQAAKTLLDANAYGFSSRRVTVSTSGIVPRIVALGQAVPVQLAISLNATTDATRSQIMPINRKWPIAELLAALRDYPLAPRRRITIEYVLLKDINDTPADAKRLITLLEDIPVKINLLPLNPHDQTPYQTPSKEVVGTFQSILYRAGHNVLVRTPRGQDVAAACGQLGDLERARSLKPSPHTTPLPVAAAAG